MLHLSSPTRFSKASSLYIIGMLYTKTFRSRDWYFWRCWDPDQTRAILLCNNIWIKFIFKASGTGWSQKWCLYFGREDISLAWWHLAGIIKKTAFSRSLRLVNDSLCIFRWSINGLMQNSSFFHEGIFIQGFCEVWCSERYGVEGQKLPLIAFNMVTCSIASTMQ